MGYGKIFRCKKCGYVYEMFTGIGMAYPMVYEETMETARNGELGETLKSFVQIIRKSCIKMRFANVSSAVKSSSLPVGKKPFILKRV